MANSIVVSQSSGSSVEVQKDDVQVVSSSSILNFEGNPVSVLDDGSGKATITISPQHAVNLLYRHNGSVTQTISSTYSVILFGTSVRSDTDYSYSSGVITFQRAGWYKVIYEVSIGSNNSIRTGSQVTAFVDSSIYAGSESWGYHRNATNSQNTVSGTFLLQTSIGTTLDIRAKYLNGTTLVTLENGSRLCIERME